MFHDRIVKRRVAHFLADLNHAGNLMCLAFAHQIRNGGGEDKDLQRGKKMGNTPLDDSIMEHLRMKRISAEEAYDKCLDKRKFRPFLATPPLDDEI